MRRRDRRSLGRLSTGRTRRRCEAAEGAGVGRCSSRTLKLQCRTPKLLGGMQVAVGVYLGFKLLMMQQCVIAGL